MPTLETLAAVSVLREYLPALKIRVVNVVDLMKLQPHAEHPHGLSDIDFDALFTRDKPVIFAFHAYPWLIHRLTYRRTNHDNIHVRGYKEEGTITTPFDRIWWSRNELTASHLVIDAIDRLPQTGAVGLRLESSPAQGEADGAHAVHREIRRGPAGGPPLEVERAAGGYSSSSSTNCSALSPVVRRVASKTLSSSAGVRGSTTTRPALTSITTVGDSAAHT